MSPCRREDVGLCPGARGGRSGGHTPARVRCPPPPCAASPPSSLRRGPPFNSGQEIPITATPDQGFRVVSCPCHAQESSGATRTTTPASEHHSMLRELLSHGKRTQHRNPRSESALAMVRASLLYPGLTGRVARGAVGRRRRRACVPESGAVLAAHTRVRLVVSRLRMKIENS